MKAYVVLPSEIETVGMRRDDIAYGIIRITTRMSGAWTQFEIPTAALTLPITDINERYVLPALAATIERLKDSR